MISGDKGKTGKRWVAVRPLEMVPRTITQPGVTHRRRGGARAGKNAFCNFSFPLKALQLALASRLFSI